MEEDPDLSGFPVLRLGIDCFYQADLQDLNRVCVCL
jgi:hypothetical protein